MDQINTFIDRALLASGGAILLPLMVAQRYQFGRPYLVLFGTSGALLGGSLSYLFDKFIGR